ncbi:MAG: glycosyltransferase [Candidatus Omnitrophica bacterium]|nr:glycosyltransferase [Candidatus Omnitrophota bacterium]
MLRIEVSVIIPTFNRKSRLRTALQSVISQNQVIFEVIVVDDGSNDETELMVKKEFPSVQYVYQENRGPSAARNHGLALAKGQWMAFLDSDDEWLPGKLRAQLDFFASHPDYRICQTEEIWIRDGTRVNPMKKHQKYHGWIFEKCLPLCLVSPSAVMIHRSIFENVGTFDEDFPACEDYELWLRITCQYPVGLIEKLFIKKFGGHPDQLSHRYEAMDRFRIKALEKILKSGKLTLEQKKATREMLDEKTRIYLQGAAKRGKDSLQLS